ncbi:hypothetical protein FB381_4693 [Nocardioides albertanoniae]|uniref:Sulfotransferase family protein n=1 Tax=Nocardioides albertanoniae TaxID=1175486 RepID=A0A543ADU5_9ACTN|nr:hypothetical protein [Nocardioides albertanoniae]TQL70751.1 hypothetical protein FB381_4693 [Nocardioides albertanoniae]
MKSIVIHAGLPKTGTSAVQAFLSSTNDRLAEAGIFYPRHTVDKNSISAGNAGSLMELSGHLFVASPREVTKTLEDFDASGCHTLLLSSEAFLPELPELADLMPPETRFVLYVRDPLAFLESDYNQRVKRLPHVHPFAAEPDAYGGWLGHQHLYHALGSESVRSRLVLRPYRPELFVGGNLLTDLFDTAGIDATELGDLSLKQVNLSYSLHALEIKRALNALPLGEQLQERLDVHLQSCPLGPTSYTLIPPADHQRLRKLADDELRALALRYDIDTLEPMRELLWDQAPKPFHPQQLTDDEVDAVVQHIATVGKRLTRRIAQTLVEHPEIELVYPSLRESFARAAAALDEPAAAPRRRWWHRTHTAG